MLVMENYKTAQSSCSMKGDLVMTPLALFVADHRVQHAHSFSLQELNFLNGTAEASLKLGQTQFIVCREMCEELLQ